MNLPRFHMKRVASTLLISLVALVASAALAIAALRVPQVPVVGGGLQAYLISVGETINVNTDQDATQTWSQTTSGITTFTIKLRNLQNIGSKQFEMYNGSAVNPPRFILMGGSTGVRPDDFSTATFEPGNLLTVRFFTGLGALISTTTYGGVDGSNFGLDLSALPVETWTQDARNPGGLARAIAFRGTGANAGKWWLCWDEPLPGAPGDQDFDDLVVLMESVNPTPVSKTSWGSVKARFK